MFMVHFPTLCDITESCQEQRLTGGVVKWTVEETAAHSLQHVCTICKMPQYCGNCKTTWWNGSDFT